MTIVNTSSAVKTLKEAIPTVNESGNVISWHVNMEYSLNDYVSNFSENIKIEEPSKAPADYSKAEVIGLFNTDHWDSVYESQYTSVKMPEPTPVETVVSDFNVDSLQ